MFRTASQIHDECQDQKTNNCDDLDAGEDKFCLAVDLDGENVEADDEHNDDGDPNSHTDMLGTFPISYDDGRRGDFGAECDGRSVPVLKLLASVKQKVESTRRFKDLHSIRRQIREHHPHNGHRIEG